MTEMLGASLAQQFDHIHNVIYTTGAIRPVNTAIEELGKYLAMSLWVTQNPDAVVGGGSAREAVGATLPDRGDLKRVFAEAKNAETFRALLPNGHQEGLWPEDEPLRLTDPMIARLVFDALLPIIEERQVGDPLGLAFDVFLRGRYDHAGGLGTYLTPEPVTTAMARVALELTDPFSAQSAQRGPVFGDPCAGTGRFLVSMLREAETRYGRNDEDAIRAWASQMFGADQSASSVAKARLNMILYGVENPLIFTVDDSLVSTELDSFRNSIRLILTNPPFGDRKYANEEGIRRSREVIPEIPARASIDPALAFVARCLDLLVDGGVAGIVLPDGLVDGKVLRGALARTALPIGATEVSLEGVISLPKATFAPSGTVAKTSVVFLRRQKARNGFVFLAESHHVGFLKAGGQIVADPQGDDLPRIGTLIAEGPPARTTEGTVVCDDPLVTWWDRQRELVLDARRSSDMLSHASAANDGVELRSLIKVKPSKRHAPDPSLPYISVLHIDELGCLAWDQVLQHHPSTPGIQAAPGDVIVSLLNPSKLRATVVPDDAEGVIVSPEFGVFSSTCDPYAVVALLYRPEVAAQLAPLGRGTSSSRRRIAEEDVLRLRVPELDDDRLDRLGCKMRALLETVMKSRLDILNLRE